MTINSKKNRLRHYVNTAVTVVYYSYITQLLTSVLSDRYTDISRYVKQGTQGIMTESLKFAAVVAGIFTNQTTLMVPIQQCRSAEGR